MIILDVIDFDVILGIDWLFPHRVILDCYAKIVTLAMLGRSIKWKGLSDTYPSKVYLMFGIKSCLIDVVYLIWLLFGISMLIHL